MSHREFRDSIGVVWEVWDIHPKAAEQVMGAIEAVGAGGTPHGGADGRRARSGVDASLASGWLCFSAADGRKRRLAPIPDDWHGLDEPRLRALCEMAAPVPPRPDQRHGKGATQPTA